MNHLSKETSPYLLQHANNPVDWFAWKPEAFEKAKLENKLLIISIGYSACHWCHVMEHQVFEDEECAALMNKHFVSIKVDREEFPDVDHLYMDAMHLMGQRGGWPLNVFAMPDGRPIYGGTYIPKEKWLGILENLADLYQNDTQKVHEYAVHLERGLRQINTLAGAIDKIGLEVDFLHQTVEHWSQYWDAVEGGTDRAPKFPMPTNWNFLLNYAILAKDARALDQVILTAEKMCLGGIYDQIGGGFARYSVDGIWKVPHFEKMLYDNAQLISLLAKLSSVSGSNLFLQSAEQSFGFVQRELLSNEGLFYSALDADSEGVEGKFYTWKVEELKAVLGDEYKFALAYYGIGEQAYWELDQNILLRPFSNSELKDSMGWSEEYIAEKSRAINALLLSARESRVRPGLDNKIITSWNAMMISAICDLCKATGSDTYRTRAISAIEALTIAAISVDGKVRRIISSQSEVIHGCLEDYAHLAQACLDVYVISSEEKWLDQSHSIVESMNQIFFEEVSGLYRYGQKSDVSFSVEKKEILDNVIPSSNAVVAKLLHRLSILLEKPGYADRSIQMLRTVLPMLDYAGSYSEWLDLYCMHLYPSVEVVVTGEMAMSKASALRKNYHPSMVVVASTIQSELPLFNGRNGTVDAIYVCKGNACMPPVQTVEDALSTILHEI
jgi:uncharacterized protein